MQRIQFSVTTGLLVAASLTLLSLIYLPSAIAQQGGKQRGGRPPPLVITDSVRTELINDRIKVVGNGLAKASVSVVPLSNGLLSDILVSAGQKVAAGDVLARLDDEEQLIARDRAARTLQEARRDVSRLEQLFKTRSTPEVELVRAQAALSDAEFELRDAELKFARRTITAPIAGIVGFVSVDKGNYVTTQDELLTIDDRSTLVVEFWVPERFANQIELGQAVSATALSSPARQHEGTVTGIASRIETDSRTLPARASIDNKSDTLRPGMSFELNLSFEGESFPAINPLAIQWDSTGSFVWKLIEDKVSKQPVRIIQRNPESILIDADLKPGDRVVTEGVLSLRQGASVRTSGGSKGQGQGQKQKQMQGQTQPETQPQTQPQTQPETQQQTQPQPQTQSQTSGSKSP
ncbi:MAG: efflux RND transporter periplasmic adaptor subunit [Granulosicoccus sp.]|nr:efflux RND transporter periplasmic adaptor subunit [Granulosicoccus sp.]